MAITKTFPVAELVFGRGNASVREEVERVSFTIVTGEQDGHCSSSNPFLNGKYRVSGKLLELCRSNTSQAVRRRHQESTLILNDGTNFTALKLLLGELQHVLPHDRLSRERHVSYVSLEWDFIVVGCPTDMLDLVPRERPARVIAPSISAGVREWRAKEPEVEIVQSLDELLSFLGSTREEIQNAPLKLNAEGGAASGMSFIC